MRRSSLSAAVGAAILTLATGLTATVTTSATAAPDDADVVGADRADRISGQYIVVLEDDTVAGRLARLHSRTLDLDVRHVYEHALTGYSARMPAAVAARVADLPGVQWVQADTVMRTTAQSTPTGIDRADADLSPTASIDGIDDRVDVDVAVIDTGADLDHPDLNVNRAGAKNCSLLSLSANDGNGHGTHVSGTIGALDNGDGVVGMAPGARIWPVKVLSDLGFGSTSDVICGIDYVTAHADEIEVANMSLGGGGEDDGNCGMTNNDAQHQAICESVAAGVTYVVAAGNDAADASQSTPAAYDEVITVSALADFDGKSGGGAASTCRADQDDTFADFSNYGEDVDLTAPGVCIESTWLSGGYNTISGTSMASPHVAGAAALYLVSNPGASPSQVQAALQQAGGTDWDAGDDPGGTKEPLLDASTY